MSKPEEWGTVNEAAAHWHVHRDTIDRWVKQGKVSWKPMPSGRKLIRLADQSEQDAAILAKVLAPKRQRTVKR